MGVRHTHPGAGRSFKHPRRNLKTTVRICSAQATVKNNIACLIDRLVDADPKTEPRIPTIAI
jgi:hypothetical protein